MSIRPPTCSLCLLLLFMLAGDAAAEEAAPNDPVPNDAAPNDAASWHSTVRPFLESHCIDCHRGDAAEANLDLSALSPRTTNPDVLRSWIKVHDKLQSGEMPPPEMPKPSESQLRPLLATLANALHQASADLQDQRGRVQFRRLNRVEYEHTLRDLLALPRLEVLQMLPPDAQSHGFDNVGSALRVSYVQMARYLDAANKALWEAAWLAPKIERYEFHLPFTDIHRFNITKDRVTIGDEAVILRQPNTAQTPWRLDRVEIPFPGEHKIRIRARAATYRQGEENSSLDNEVKGELVAPEFPHIVSVYQGTRLLGSIDVVAEPQTREITAWLDQGEQLILYVPTMDDWNPKWTKGAYTGPAVALQWLQIEGPADTSWPTPSYRALFDDLPIELWSEESGCSPPKELGELKRQKNFPKLEMPHKKSRYLVVSERPLDDARRLLKRFMGRAFRRPVPKGEMDRYLALVQAELDEHKPFHEALITGYAAILASPDFLYFLESPGRLDGYALASRLSYFLWRSKPDEALLALADGGELLQDEVLAQQVDRMLADPKAQRFIEDFTGQWLDLREIRDTQPDDKLYPEFDDFLLESMVAETRAFFDAMIDRNLPARSVVATDFAIVNNVLADLYDVDGVEGVELREVKLPADSPRGGLITQASVLKVTANGTTTSPVVRGAWVLDRLLGSPAPPPPPNVPAIEPDTRGATTVRELLAKHRADPACAACHARIDPPGFALESFDVIGAWRERYRSLDQGDKVQRRVDGRPVRYKLALEVDPSGELADGRSFQDIDEFRRLLIKDERQLARNLSQRLIVFATGGGISFADRAEVEAILDRTRYSGYAVRDMIHEIVQSDIFRKK